MGVASSPATAANAETPVTAAMSDAETIVGRTGQKWAATDVAASTCRHEGTDDDSTSTASNGAPTAQLVQVSAAAHVAAA